MSDNEEQLQPFKKKKKVVEENNELLKKAMTLMEKVHDDCYYFSMSVAAKIRRMNDIQRIHAEKLISDILYSGLLNKLSERTTIVYEAEQPMPMPMTMPMQMPMQWSGPR